MIKVDRFSVKKLASKLIVKQRLLEKIESLNFGAKNDNNK